MITSHETPVVIPAALGPRRTPAAVVRLLDGCSPSAVAGLVASVVVDAVDGVGGRGLWSHIAQECGVTIAPLCAHGDAASAVACELGVRRAEASALQSLPRPVFGVAPASVSGAVTAAACDPPEAQLTTDGHALVAAIALANPPRSTSDRSGGTPDHDETAVPAPLLLLHAHAPARSNVAANETACPHDALASAVARAQVGAFACRQSREGLRDKHVESTARVIYPRAPGGLGIVHSISIAETGTVHSVSA